MPRKRSGAPTWRNLTSLYAARPPLRAARIGALINFIALDVQAFASLSSVVEMISAVSPSPSDRSDYELFYHTSVLDAFLRREPSRGRCLSLMRFDKNLEQFGIDV